MVVAKDAEKSIYYSNMVSPSLQNFHNRLVDYSKYHKR